MPLKFPTVAVFLAFVRKQIGIKESPMGSNRQPFGVWFHWNGVAWCAIFICYCLWMVGVLVTKSASAYGLGKLLLKIPEAKRIAAKDVHGGDICIMTWSHIEVCEARQSSEGVVDIGGNVGNKVARLPRANSSIAYGIRLPWAKEEADKPQTPSRPEQHTKLKIVKDTQGWNMTHGTKRRMYKAGGTMDYLGQPYTHGGNKYVLVGNADGKAWIRLDHARWAN